MSNTKDDDGSTLAAILIIFVIGGFIGMIIGATMKPDFIESDVILKPKIKLYVKDNVIDTTYIYKVK